RWNAAVSSRATSCSRSSGAAASRTGTERWTSSSAVCARRSTGARPGTRSSSRATASATGWTPSPRRNRSVRRARLRAPDAEEPLGLVLDLQRRVVDVETRGEQLLELSPDRVAVVAGTDEHVRRERREARGDRPDVEVV